MSDASGHIAALEPRRTEREVFRVSAEEKAKIAAIAAIHGLLPGTYARRAALGQLAPAGSQSPASGRTKLSIVNVGTTPAGGIVKERIVAEVEEAKLEDDPAREAFLERRTRELYGQGKTTKLARAEAEAEWRNR